jgi:hypothetical protein
MALAFRNMKSVTFSAAGSPTQGPDMLYSKQAVIKQAFKQAVSFR